MGGRGRTGTIIAAVIVHILESHPESFQNDEQENVKTQYSSISLPKLVAVAVNRVREKDREGHSIESISQIESLFFFFYKLTCKREYPQDFSERKC